MSIIPNNVRDAIDYVGELSHLFSHRAVPLSQLLKILLHFFFTLSGKYASNNILQNSSHIGGGKLVSQFAWHLSTIIRLTLPNNVRLGAHCVSPQCTSLWTTSLSNPPMSPLSKGPMVTPSKVGESHVLKVVRLALAPSPLPTSYDRGQGVTSHWRATCRNCWLCEARRD